MGPPIGKYMILLMILDLRSANNLHSNVHCIFGGGVFVWFYCHGCLLLDSFGRELLMNLQVKQFTFAGTKDKRARYLGRWMINACGFSQSMAYGTAFDEV